MKKMLLLALLGFYATTAYCNLNTYCSERGGKILYDRPSSMHMLCLIGGAAVGLGDFYYQVDEQLSFQGVKLFCSRTTIPPFADSYTPLIPNPASEYCESAGGKILATTLFNTDEGVGICHFKDGSDIEQWTLYRGANHKKNLKMSGILKCGVNGADLQ